MLQNSLLLLNRENNFRKKSIQKLIFSRGICVSFGACWPSFMSARAIGQHKKLALKSKVSPRTPYAFEVISSQLYMSHVCLILLRSFCVIRCAIMTVYTDCLQKCAALNGSRLNCRSTWAQYKRLRQRTRSSISTAGAA